MTDWSICSKACAGGKSQLLLNYIKESLPVFVAPRQKGSSSGGSGRLDEGLM